MKVIACTLDNVTYQYLAIDQSSGGYPYWTNRLRSAEMYSDSVEDQRSMQWELDGITGAPDRTFSDGEVSPNVMKHSALNLSNTKRSGRGSIVVFEIKLEREQTIV